MITSWQNSVVLMRSNDPGEKSFGTGFVLFKDSHYTYFLTCTHVVKEIGDQRLRVNGFQAKVVACGPEENADLAVLRIEGLFPSPALPLYAICEEGDSYSTSGFQLTAKHHVLRLLHGALGKQVRLEGKEQADRVTAWDLEITDKDLLHEGYSGSPVVNRHNQVIGVVSTLQGDGKRGMAISIGTLETIWSELPLKYVYVLDHFERRNQLAKQVIVNYAQMAATKNITVGLGKALVPFRGTDTRIGSLSAESLLVYHPMIKDLAKIYTASSDILIQKDIDVDSILDAAVDLANEYSINFLLSEFDKEFFGEFLKMLLEERRSEVSASAIHVATTVYSLFSKTKIKPVPPQRPMDDAATLTWRVGVTVALYFFNGQEWLQDLKQPNRLGPLLPNQKDWPDKVFALYYPKEYRDCPKEYRAMWEKNVKGLIHIIHSVKRVHPSLSTNEISSLLKENGYPEGTLAEALKRVEKLWLFG
jgi:hypothetical protein